MKTPENKEIIVSSRVRLARNLSGLPFPSRLKDDRAHKIAYDVYSALGGESSPFRLYYVGAEDVTDMVVLKEKHLISDDLLHNQKYGG
ncbi:MAG: ATP--guanido phosphotransferase, partial [Firmicutes bacterium]|nr:ATP--guanido phosphotransferase [Bacillota bacterium]